MPSYASKIITVGIVSILAYKGLVHKRISAVTIVTVINLVNESVPIVLIFVWLPRIGIHFLTNSFSANIEMMARI